MTRFAYLICLVLLISCVRNATPPAIVVNTYEQPELPASTINLPITIKLNSVFEEANKSIPTTFKGKEDVCEGVSYDYSFKRDNNLRFQTIRPSVTLNGILALLLHMNGFNLNNW